MALPRAMRFQNRAEVRRVLSRGSSLRTAIGRIVFAPSPHPVGRTLFVISRAVSKSSARRHRLKRELDEWVRRYRGQHPDRPDIVIFVAPPVAALSRGERARLLARTFSRFN